VLHDQAQIHAFTGQGNDHVETLAGDDVVHTGAGSDIITNISGNDQIYSGHGQDRVTSYSGNTLVDDRGDAKDQDIALLDDIIITGFGDDTVHAGAEQDVVVTDLPGSIYYGSDHLIGMTGDDILFGGRGSDTFVFRAGDGNDTIGAIDMDTVSSAKEIKDIEFIASDFMSGVDTVQLQFDTHFVGSQLSDVIAENTDWFWLETEGGITLSTSDGSLHFWGLTGNQLSDTDFEFIG